ncbi:MAG: family 43 glycosylhydrolase [Lachnospiraceae bacterium]|nr:family 43 glycosylhydrolase [Lachnospiraceae bacterium]
MNQTLIIYTRQAVNNIIYDPRLAYSMHLAYVNEQNQAKAFNHNSGVFFVKATENADGSLNPKSLENPYVFKTKQGTYGILATRIEGDGGEDAESKEHLVYAETNDFIRYEEKGLISIHDAALSREINAYFQEREARVTECKKYDFSGIEGIVCHQVITITDSQMAYLHQKLLTPEMVEVKVPNFIQLHTKEDLEHQFVDTIFSDGTIVPKKITMDANQIDFTRPGKYTVNATLTQMHFKNPIAIHRADPDVTFWNGKYYFIATNDADHNHTLYIRESDTLEGLATAEEHLILDSDTYDNIKGLLWAPEFHEIDGRLYIFHAATREEFFAEESRLMTLNEGGNPLNREDWSRPERIVRMDGSELCEEGKEITLDMTCFLWEGDYYAIWSQRQFLPKDLGAWLYIAKLNPKKPWMLASEPIVLSKPNYGWGNNHTFVEEGPFALINGDTLYITFSAAAVDVSYVVSYLSIRKGQDLLTPSNWFKNNYPILTARSVAGEYGTGHNAYVIDESGTVWNTYHARFGTDAPRSSAIRRVHFDVDGAPMLDVTEELDIKESLKNIKVVVEVK